MRVPIVTYHAVGDVDSILWTKQNVFEQHMRGFAKRGLRTISLAQLSALLSEGKPLPKDAIVLTFDDGYESVYKDAFPVMKQYGFTATVFLITDFLGGDNHWPGQPPSVPKAKLLTWQQVEELAGNGWEFGAHTRTHVALTQVQQDIAFEQVVSSKKAVAEHTSQAGRVFAYPYGDTNPQVVDLVKGQFDAAVGTSLGLVDTDSNPYLMPRIDSYYLSEQWIAQMDKLPFRQYLKLRQALRAVRRLVQRDYYSAPANA